MTTKTAKWQAALERRVNAFYKSLNQHKVAACYQMIDPQVHDASGSVTLYPYGEALHEFMARFGPLMVHAIHLTLHLDEPSQLYQGRDFAVGKTTLLDAAGNRHVFLELGPSRPKLVHPLHGFRDAPSGIAGDIGK